MRRRWSIFAVTLILASGGILATYPATAAAGASGPAAGVVQPGGPVDHLVTPRSAQAAAGQQIIVSSSDWAATGPLGPPAASARARHHLVHREAPRQARLP